MSIPTPIAKADAERDGRRCGESAAVQPEADAPKTPRLKWMDVFETGHPEIDSLHHKLFEDCDRLMLLVAQDAPWPQIVAEARTLVANCIAHFRVEEEVLERTGFPRREAHRTEHRRMERDMKHLIGRMEQVDGSLGAHRTLPASLGPVVIDLMIRHDLDYCSHLLYLKGR